MERWARERRWTKLMHQQFALGFPQARQHVDAQALLGRQGGAGGDIDLRHTRFCKKLRSFIT
jgi:hypothetical protein